MNAWVLVGGSSVGVLGLAALALWWRLSCLREAVARCGHELRGPLCAARLGLELASRAGVSSVAQVRALELELDRMELALADLEQVRGGARSQLDLRPVAPDRLLADCVNAWRPAAEARGVALDARWSGPADPVLADRVRLAQALENLIANALEHGRGPVHLRGIRDVRGVKLEVLDAGAGLPAPLPALIRPRRRRRAGLDRGRGLGIARAAAQAHGGELTTAPSRQGARLVLRIPLGAAETAARVSRSGD